MPSAWSLIDASFPTFTGEERTRDQMNVMLNYMFMLSEGLKYQLSNLNDQNFNSTALKKIQTDTTASVEEQVAEILADLETIRNSIGSINGKLIALGEWKESADLELSRLDDALRAQADTLSGHGQSISALEGIVAADGSGGATIGKEGSAIRLVGQIYINGTLIE